MIYRILVALVFNSFLSLYVSAQTVLDIKDIYSLNIGLTYESNFSNFFESSATGDFNGDGIEDMILGRFASVTLIFGDENPDDLILFTNQLNGTKGIRVTNWGTMGGEDASVNVASGDLDNDGLDDLIIGLPGLGGISRGTLYVIYGSTTLDLVGEQFPVQRTDGSNGFALEAPSSRSYLGSAVDSDDLNGDGIDDLIFTSGSLNTYVVYGSNNRINGADLETLLETPVAEIDSSKYMRVEMDLRGIGYRDVRIGDVNGDAVQDMIISDNHFDDSRGQIIGIYGRGDQNPGYLDLIGDDEVDSLKLATFGGFTLEGSVPSGRFAWDFDLGDANGDAADDIVISNPDVDYNEDAFTSIEGQAYLYYGSAESPGVGVMIDSLTTENYTLFRDVADTTFPFSTIDQRLATDVAIADVNSDGLGDVIIDSREYRRTSVIFGNASGLGTLSDLTTVTEPDGFMIINGAGVGSSFVYTTVWTGDHNGDGNQDIGLVKDDKVYIITGILSDQSPVSNEEPDMVSNFVLEQNYPNPFNPSTTIGFSLSEPAQVRIDVYDMLGRKVAELMNEFRSSGSHSVSFDARGLSSGMYIYRLQSGNRVTNRTMTLIK